MWLFCESSCVFRLHTKGIFKKRKRVNWDRDCFLFKQAFGSLTATIQLLLKTKWKIYKDRLRVCTEIVPSNTGRKHSVRMQNMPVTESAGEKSFIKFMSWTKNVIAAKLNYKSHILLNISRLHTENSPKEVKRVHTCSTCEGGKRQYLQMTHYNHPYLKNHSWYGSKQLYWTLIRSNLL